ncbi:MAG TPA: hypothetical protein VFZ35_01825 [Sphingomicrobium sp.]
MRSWLQLLGGLLIWAAHFFLLYAFASIWPGSQIARWLTLAVTAGALAADGAIIWLAAKALEGGDDDQLAQWMWRFAFAGALLSSAAVVWQGLPALM